MSQIEDGLFMVKEAMPCNPKEIMVGKYTIFGVLEKPQQDEAAARILWFSQEVDRWVGVSWKRFSAAMIDELEQYNNIETVQRQNVRKKAQFLESMQWYRTNCILTLGIYSIFVKKPELKLVEVPPFNMPTSRIFLSGMQPVVQGLYRLMSYDLIQHVEEVHDGELIDVLYPSPTLVKKIMENQGVTKLHS